MSPQNSQTLERINRVGIRLGAMPQTVREGTLFRVTGLLFEVQGLPMSTGERATVSLGPDRAVEAECIGFNSGITYLMPIDPVESVTPGASVYPIGTPYY